MEIFPSIEIPIRKSLVSFQNATEMWQYALSHVFQYRQNEINEYWSAITNKFGRDIHEREFVIEYIFSVHTAGYSARVVSKHFENILKAHNVIFPDDVWGEHWDYQPITLYNLEPNWDILSKAIGNKKKAAAIKKTRSMILDLGWKEFDVLYVKEKSPEKISKLPFMGPALSYHVARNIGNIDSVKPDIHLIRLANKYGFKSPQQMCEDINPSAPAAYNDLVLWIASADLGTR